MPPCPQGRRNLERIFRPCSTCCATLFQCTAPARYHHGIRNISAPLPAAWAEALLPVREVAPEAWAEAQQQVRAAVPEAWAVAQLPLSEEDWL